MARRRSKEEEKRFSLAPYQRRGRDFCLENKYAILAMEMGLGKTFTSLEVFNTLYDRSVRRNQGRADKQRLGEEALLIVCPANLIPTWQREIQKFYGSKFLVDVVSAGNKVYRLFDTDIVITSYSLVQKAEHFFNWATMVIVDESHNLSSMESKRTTFLHKSIYENQVPRLALLTGTPIKNRVREYYSLLALCHYNPEIEETGEDFLNRFPDDISFADYFSIREEYQMKIKKKNGKKGRRFNVVQWNGTRNRKELKRILKPFYFRLKSEDYLDLPPYLEKSVLVSSTPNHALLKEFEAYFSSGGEEEEDRTKATPTFKREAAMKTVPFTVEYVKGLLSQGVGKVLVFSDHPGPAEAIAAELGGGFIHAGVSGKRRDLLTEKFQHGDLQVLSGTFKTLGTGYTLTSAWNTVFNDIPWVPSDERQAIYRLHRISQKRRVVVHRIFGSPQAEKIWEALEEKRSVIKKVT